MPFLSGLTHLVGDVAAPVAEGAGAIGSLGGLAHNGAATSLTNLGHNISNPNVTLSNPGGILASNNKAFTGPGAYGTPVGATAGNVATWGSGVGTPATDQTGTGGSATGSAGSYDPSAVAYLDGLQGQANDALGRLGTQGGIARQNVLDAYNNAFNTLLGQKATTTRDYNTNKDQTLQDYVGARGNIQAGVGQAANALQHLLGAHGYTGSANIAANYAAARQGSQQNQQVGQTYGRNQQALDTSYNDYLGQERNSENSLGTQRDQQLNQAQSKIDQNKQSLLSQLANIAQQRSAYNGGSAAQISAAAAPYASQIGQLGNEVDQLGRDYASPVLQAAPAVYNAPSLDQYTYNQAAAPTLSQAPGAADNLSPFLSVLLGQNQNKKNLNNLG